MNSYINPSRDQWAEITSRPTFDFEELFEKVGDVLKNIKRNGDDALKLYTKQFDKIDLESFQVTSNEVEDAHKSVSNELKKAIDIARGNIEKFHLAQKSTLKSIETSKGVKCWQKSVPVTKVGLYVPGGLAPLFSTVLMLGIPAAIAGCEEVVLCTPPDKDGNIHPAIIYTANLIGIHKVFKLGGIQAIGAMAYGTETVPQVYKIFGPGNQYVTAAKQYVSFSGTAIDMPAGPSEVAVVADQSANPAYVAADLLSQAEHGPDSQVLLIANSKKVIEDVKTEINKQLEVLPRKDIAEKALQNSRLVVLENLQDTINMVNEYAPEHLIIATENYQEISSNIVNAGSVFLGNYSMESAGDYASGTNHTLPTNGAAKAYSGVNLDSFMKKITYQEISAEGIKNIGPAIETMAKEEQLEAHKNAVTLRLNDLEL